jgi:hypothetical protein
MPSRISAVGAPPSRKSSLGSGVGQGSCSSAPQIPGVSACLSRVHSPPYARPASVYRVEWVRLRCSVSFNCCRRDPRAAQRLESAAAHVDDAFRGIYMAHHARPWLQRAHAQLAPLRWLTTTAYLGVAFVERPLWCFRTECNVVDQPEIDVPLSGLPILSRRTTIGVEMTCVTTCIPSTVCVCVRVRLRLLAAFKDGGCQPLGGWALTTCSSCSIPGAAVMTEVCCPCWCAALARSLTGAS